MNVEKQNVWFEVTTSFNEFGIEVLGFNRSWIDEDFNPDGTCLCFCQDSDPPYWMITKWCGDHDEWHTRYSREAVHSLGKEFGGHGYIDAPTHIILKQNPPITSNSNVPKESGDTYVPSNIIAPNSHELYRSHALDSDIYTRPTKPQS